MPCINSILRHISTAGAAVIISVDMITNIYINGFPLAIDDISYIREVQGITAPTIDLNTYNRGGRDGIVLGNPYYRQRVFTVTLALVAGSPEELLTQKDRLVTALRLQQYGDSRYKLVEFETADGHVRATEAIVKQISGELKPETSYAYTPLTFQMIANRWYLEGEEHTLEVSDPNRGGMPVPMNVPMTMANNPEGSSSQIANGGNTDSLPTFHVTGPLTGFDIYNQTTGQHLTATYTLAAGEYVDLDCYNHSAIANSVTNVRGSISGDWPVLAPGSNELNFIAATSASGAKATITFKDAYLGI